MALALDKQQTKQKQDLGRIDDGTYPARVVQIIDLGMQVQTDWQTQEPKTYDDGNTVIKPEAYVNFEFPTERITINEEDKPRWCGKQYVISSHEKAALMGLMAATAPGSNNVADALTKPCTVTIGSTSGGNAKVTNVAPIMKGMTVPELENPAVVFDFDNPDMSVWDNIPNWIKEKIKSATNYEGSKLSKLVEQTQSESNKTQSGASNFDDFDTDDIPY